MFKLGDLVMMNEDKLEPAVFGFIIRLNLFDSMKPDYYTVEWFDGMKSEEFEESLIKVENG